MPAEPLPVARPRPIITANQVTLARLVLLPIGGWLLYQGERGQWFCLLFMTFVGCTDFVDGWLARRYGPTILGGLMDPMADKIFIAVTFLPMIDPKLGWLPVLPVVLLFVREFAVTAARTAYRRRGLSLRTSYLAKVKTWFSMNSSGVIFLLLVVPARPMLIVLCAGAVLSLVGGGVFYAIKRRVWPGAFIFALCWAVVLVLYWKTSARVSMAFIAWAAVSLALASGIAYLLDVRQLRGRGAIDAGDLARLAGAVALPVLGGLVISRGVAPAWPIIAAVSLELAIGGLDNLLSHSDVLLSWRGWALRVLAQTVLLGAALYLSLQPSPPAQLVELLSLGALAVTAASVAIAFYRHRRIYLAPPAPMPVAPATPAAAVANAAPPAGSDLAI